LPNLGFAAFGFKNEELYTVRMSPALQAGAVKQSWSPAQVGVKI
jgi:hypothetical protein